MLGKLLGVTIVTSNIQETVDVYGKYLGFSQIGEGTVSAGQAGAWGAPNAEGNKFVVLQPAGGEESFIRFIESEISPDYRPLTTLGWNAAEIVVKDLDKLADELASSPFKIIGPPAVLEFDFTDKIRAMQVVGPSGEVLYLTEIEGDIPGFDLPTPRDEVGQTFVAVLGVRSIADMRAYILKTFGLEFSDPFGTKVTILADAYGLDHESKFNIAAGNLTGQTLIELDEYPAAATERPRAQNGLPMGIALATFRADEDLQAKASRIEGRNESAIIADDGSIWELAQ